MRDILPRIYRPEAYQGKRNPRKYFEGWYTKLVSPGGKDIWSFICGLSFAEDHHGFIQVIHANSGQTWYIPFPVEQTEVSRKHFSMQLGDSVFSRDGMSLALSENGFSASGRLEFRSTESFPASLVSPGIMGWYSYVPGMECYHGVVSMHHAVHGSLEIGDKDVSFEGGRGYIEKDWGRSMPSDWIWVQSNHFDSDPDASFMLSVARIPWMKSFFPGFLSFLKVGGKLYRFATYNRSKIDTLVISDEEVLIEIRHPRYQLKVRALRREGGILKAPRHGEMDRDIKESIISGVELELRDRSGSKLFQGRGSHAGLEIVGDVARYF